MYQRKTYDLGNCIEVEENHTGKYGAPGQQRQKKRKRTKEEIAEVNRKNRKKMIRRLLRKNFNPGDYWTTLTFRKDERPATMEEAVEIAKKFMKSLREAYKRKGEDLKYIVKVEKGGKGAYHIHTVLSRIRDTDLIVQKLWKRGGIHTALLYAEGQYKDLANYLGKWPGDKTETGRQISMVDAWYSRSRNLILVEPKVEIMKGSTFRKEPKKKGYYLDKDSLVEGINKFTGYRYRTYTLIKIENERKRRI